jgi:hypothetical protein
MADQGRPSGAMPPGPKARGGSTPLHPSTAAIPTPGEPWWWGKTTLSQGRFVPVPPPEDHPLAQEWHDRYTRKRIRPDQPLPRHLALHKDAPRLKEVSR